MIMSTFTGKKTLHKRDIFKTGEYIKHFNPEDNWNPFRNIYEQKKKDTIEIISKSEASKAVLDAGGGMGRVSFALARVVKSMVVLADISIDMLKRAAENNNEMRNIELINADAHQLPFEDKSFDCVTGLDLLCHLKEPETALHEFHRVLTDKGILILDSTNSNPLWTLFYPRYLGRNPMNWLKTVKFGGVLPGWENIVKHYTKNHFHSLLKKTGFKVIQDINYGPLICPKWYLAVSEKIA
jgi:ubiquinone/menaquinone biosynthesis C-methylase UbiE